jgi:hypothetical protein
MSALLPWFSLVYHQLEEIDGREGFFRFSELSELQEYEPLYVPYISCLQLLFKYVATPASSYLRHGARRTRTGAGQQSGGQ